MASVYNGERLPHKLNQSVEICPKSRDYFSDFFIRQKCGLYSTPFNLTPSRENPLSKFIIRNNEKDFIHRQEKKNYNYSDKEIFAYDSVIDNEDDEKEELLSKHKQFYQWLSCDLMKYILKFDYHSHVYHPNSVPTSETYIPHSSCMTVHIVSLVPYGTVCPKFHLFRMNADMSALLHREFDTTISAPREIGFIPQMLLGIQKIYINPKDLESDVPYLLGRWNCRSKDQKRGEKVSLPRIFIHNGTSNMLTEIQSEDYTRNERVIRSPSSLLIGSIVKRDRWCYYVSATPTTLNPTPHVLATHCSDTNVIGRVSEFIKTIMCPVIKKPAPTPYFHGYPFSLPASLPGRLTIIPYTEKTSSRFPEILSRYSELSADILFLLILNDCRVFFRSLDHLSTFYTKLKACGNSKYISSSCNWVGSLLFSVDKTNTFIPTTTEYFPSRDNFRNLHLEDFNFTAYLFQCHFNNRQVDIWMGMKDTGLFDTIRYRLNCEVHVFLDMDGSESFLSKVEEIKHFFHVFDNSEYYFHTPTGGAELFLTTATTPFLTMEDDSVRSLCADCPAPVELALYHRSPVELAKVIMERIQSPPVCDTLIILQYLVRRNEDYLRCVILELYHLATSGVELPPNEVPEVEYVMSRLLTLPSLPDLRNGQSLIAQRCEMILSQTVNPNVHPTVQNISPWFSNHGFMEFRFCVWGQHPSLSSCLFMDNIAAATFHTWNILKGDEEPCQNYFELLVNYNRDIFLTYTHTFWSDADCYQIIGIRLPMFCSSEVLNVVAYLSYGKTAITYPTCLHRCEKILALLDSTLSVKHFLSKNIADKRDNHLIGISRKLWEIRDGVVVTEFPLACDSLLVYIIQSLYTTTNKIILDFLFMGCIDDPPALISISNISLEKILIILQFLKWKEDENDIYRTVLRRMLDRIPYLIRIWIEKTVLGEAVAVAYPELPEFIICFFKIAASGSKEYMASYVDTDVDDEAFKPIFECLISKNTIDVNKMRYFVAKMNKSLQDELLLSTMKKKTKDMHSFLAATRSNVFSTIASECLDPFRKKLKTM